jgi:eukaryotic-like serine/threonine-protein kinase
MVSRNIEKALFEATVVIEDRGERTAFLNHVCQGDPALRTRLDDLLESANASERFFHKIETARIEAAVDACASLQTLHTDEELAVRIDVPAAEGPGSWIGRYHLQERIGEGGCGVVYLAEQEKPVRRRVALKVIRLGMDTESVIKRFEIERQSLALMDHSNIAHVLDAGATDTGRPYFVMELVQGVKITEFCDTHRLDFRQRVDLFIEVCHAIQHAHQKGVIHRDIKPSNILVSELDGKVTPKVIDFGIAKATGGHSDGQTLFTSAEHFIGTPAYMSPEQADTKSVDVDTRSDVYSLGVLLYELLTGRPPFDPAHLAAVGMYETRKILKEQDPLRPSAALADLDDAGISGIAALRGTDPAKWISQVKGDLDWVVMKAMEKDPQRRYETVNGLSMDLMRIIRNEPVTARSPSAVYLFGKFVRRNRLVVGATAGIVAALVLGLGLASISYQREVRAKQEQIILRKIAEAARANESRLLANAKVRENIALVAVLLSEGKTHEADAQLRLTPLSSIEPSLEAETVLRSLGRWNATAGRWQEAAECYALLTEASRLSSPDEIRTTKDLTAIGPVLVESGSLEKYERYRGWVISRLDPVSRLQAVEHVIKATLIRPAGPKILRRLEPIRAQFEETYKNARLVEPDARMPVSGWTTWAISLYEFRCGDYEKSIYWGDLTIDLHGKNQALQAVTHSVLAMAHQRLGHAEAAREELEKTREWIDLAFTPELAPIPEPLGAGTGVCWDWVLARILYREAQAMMAPTAKTR